MKTTKKSELAFDAILESARYEINSNLKAPTIRQVSEKSGYSIGSIYRYFKNVDALIFHAFDRCLLEVLERRANKYKSIKPHQNIDEIALFITDMIFDNLNSKIKLSLMRNLMPYVGRHTKKHYYFLSLGAKMATPLISDIQHANQTKTFKIISQEEIRFSFHAIGMNVYSPILHGSPIAGSEKHKDFIFNLIKQLFGSAPNSIV